MYTKFQWGSLNRRFDKPGVYVRIITKWTSETGRAVVGLDQRFAKCGTQTTNDNYASVSWFAKQRVLQKGHGTINKTA